MKKLIVFAFIFLFTSCSTRQHTKKTRYFFIGFDLSNNEQRHVGNFTNFGDTLPSSEYFTNLLYETYKCEGYAMNEVVITGVYEFKDSLDYLKWVNVHGGAMGECKDSTFFWHAQFGAWGSDTLYYGDKVGQKKKKVGKITPTKSDQDQYYDDGQISIFSDPDSTILLRTNQDQNYDDYGKYFFPIGPDTPILFKVTIGLSAYMTTYHCDTIDWRSKYDSLILKFNQAHEPR